MPATMTVTVLVIGVLFGSPHAQCIGCRGSWLDLPAAARRDRTDTRFNRQPGGILGAPHQLGCFARLDRSRLRFKRDDAGRRLRARVSAALRLQSAFMPAKANNKHNRRFQPASIGFESVKSVQSVAYSCFYDLISRPSASFMRLLIIEGAPLFAGDPVQEIMSPGFTVLLVQP